MSTRCSLLGLFLALMGVGVFAGPVRSQTVAAAETAALTRMLDEVIDTKDFTNPMTLKDALQLFYEKFAARGKEFSVIVDLDAFRRAEPDSPSPYEAMVQLPTVPKQMPMYVTLRMMLGQVPAKATYMIRQGHVEIVPPASATSRVLLQERVFTRADKASLREVLDDLSALTGAPIVLDARAKDKGQEIVSIVLNNMSLEDCLTVLTEQAGLRFVTLESGIFVTLPEEAKSIEERQKKRTRPAVEAAARADERTAP
jgi:hypothetical protein